jgi:hypothetical protein
MRITFEDIQRQWQKRSVQAATAAVGVAAALGATALILHQESTTSRESAPVDGSVSGPEAPSRVGKGIEDPAGPPDALPGSGSASPGGIVVSGTPGNAGAPPGLVPPGAPNAGIQGQAPQGGVTTAPGPIQQPDQGGIAAVGASPTVSTSGSIVKDRKTMRVVSAKADLTGQRELGWAADDGHEVGAAHCTQNFKIGDTEPRVRPTMVICWRTSAEKSVFTVAVDIDGKPSEKDSVATLNRVWSKMG